jgi:hypothetical protein
VIGTTEAVKSSEREAQETREPTCALVCRFLSRNNTRPSLLICFPKTSLKLQEMANMTGISIFALLVMSAACLVAVKGDVVQLTDSTFTDKVRTSALSSNLCGFLQFPSVLCVCMCVFGFLFFLDPCCREEEERGNRNRQIFGFRSVCIIRRIGVLECCVFFREARVIYMVLNRLDFSVASLFFSGAIFPGISSIFAVSGRLSPVCSFREREEPLLLWKAGQIVECLVVLRWL